MPDSFYITLPSNLNDGSYATNTIGNYTTHLARKFRFPVTEKWEVGLAEISYPKSWFNLRHNQNISVYMLSETRVHAMNTLQVTSAFVPAGHYPQPTDLIDKINQVICDNYSNECETVPRLQYDQHNQKAWYNLGQGQGDYKCFIEFGDELRQILGFPTTSNDVATMAIQATQVEQAYKSEKMIAERPIDLYAGFHTLYAYTDIVEYSAVGNTNVPILRALEVPTEKHFGEQVVLTYQRPFYIPLLSHEFQSVEIDIKQEQGKTVRFEIGRVIVVLHFRKA